MAGESIALSPKRASDARAVRRRIVARARASDRARTAKVPSGTRSADALGMPHSSFLGLLSSFALGVVFVGGCSSHSGEIACVDFAITPADLACETTSDCTFVDELHVCPGDPSCGFENPVNKAAAARYTSATSGVPRTPVQCGVATPVVCMNHVCVEATR
jgi:hypothetical protein